MFDRSWNAVLPGGAGPQVIVIDNVRLPDTNPELELEAWVGGLAGANVYIFEGDVDLGSAQAKLGVAGKLDCITVIPHGGKACVRIPSDIEERLTVFWDTAFANPQAVTIRIRSRYK